MLLAFYFTKRHIAANRGSGFFSNEEGPAPSSLGVSPSPPIGHPTPSVPTTTAALLRHQQLAQLQHLQQQPRDRKGTAGAPLGRRARQRQDAAVEQQLTSGLNAPSLMVLDPRFAGLATGGGEGGVGGVPLVGAPSAYCGGGGGGGGGGRYCGGGYCGCGQAAIDSPSRMAVLPPPQQLQLQHHKANSSMAMATGTAPSFSTTPARAGGGGQAGRRMGSGGQLYYAGGTGAPAPANEADSYFRHGRGRAGGAGSGGIGSGGMYTTSTGVSLLTVPNVAVAPGLGRVPVLEAASLVPALVGAASCGACGGTTSRSAAADAAVLAGGVGEEGGGSGMGISPYYQHPLEVTVAPRPYGFCCFPAAAPPPPSIGNTSGSRFLSTSNPVVATFSAMWYLLACTSTIPWRVLRRLRIVNDHKRKVGLPMLRVEGWGTWKLMEQQQQQHQHHLMMLQQQQAAAEAASSDAASGAVSSSTTGVAEGGGSQTGFLPSSGSAAALLSMGKAADSISAAATGGGSGLLRTAPSADQLLHHMQSTSSATYLAQQPHRGGWWVDVKSFIN